MSRALNALLVDDEPLALRRLEYDLAQVPDLKVVGTTSDSTAAVGMVRALKPDVLFLDIRMPVMNGFELIEALEPDTTPAVIFVTAFNQYATEAFEAAAADYLLKPVRLDRVQRAVERARESLELKAGRQRLDELGALVDTLKKSGGYDTNDGGAAYDREIWVSQAGGLVRVPVEAIERAEAERDYVFLRTPEKSHLIRSTFAGLEARLDPAHFQRVHRSVIVRTDAIQKVERGRSGRMTLVLDSGARVKVGRLYRDRVRGWLDEAVRRTA